MTILTSRIVGCIKKKVRNGIDGPTGSVDRIVTAAASPPPAPQVGAADESLDLLVGPSLRDDRASRMRLFAKNAREADACTLQNLVASAAARAKPQEVKATSRIAAIRARLSQHATPTACSPRTTSSGEHRSFFEGT